MAGGKTSSQPVPAADFEAIEAAVMETARGRWFLAEYARRNRATDTAAVLEALARLEAKLAATQHPAAAAVPPQPVVVPVVPPRAIAQAPTPEPAPAPREPPRIAEPDFSAVEQLFRGRSAPARPPVEVDEDPWGSEADDPPAAIVSGEAEVEEEVEVEVEEEDIEAWEAELNEFEQPATEASEEPSSPEEFSFFPKIDSRNAGLPRDETRPAVVEPPKPMARAASDWDDRPIVQPARSIFPKPETVRAAPAEMTRPATYAPPQRVEPAVPAFERPEPVRSPPPPLSERIQSPRAGASLVERAQTIRPAASMLNQPEPLRPVAPPAPLRAERVAPRPVPRVDDPTISMTRDEKLAMFS
jgi:hypothetical protein